MKRKLSIIFGEMHTLDCARQELALAKKMQETVGLDYLLMENAFNYVLDTPEKIKDKIRKQDWMIGDVHYNIGLELGLPIIGIDLDPDVKDNYEINVDTSSDFSQSFSAREKQMVKIFETYRNKGNCLLVVGDTHLRTVKTDRLGDESPLWTKYKNNKEVMIVRPFGHQREIDQELKDKRIVLRDEINL